MAIDDDLAYERNEKGERVLVRSIESISRAFLRFTNCTSRPVEVSWRDFNGKRVLYACLEPNAYYDITTYLTHPWEFTDRGTKERYVINNKSVFRAPDSIGNVMKRINWNITVGLRTLKYSALLVAAKNVVDPNHSFELELPASLENELMWMITDLRTVPRYTGK